MKIFFISLGCDKNLVDSEIMLGIIKEDSHEIVDDLDRADIVIINTCGFISDATEEGIENILSIAKLKKQNKIKGLIVTGCMVQRYKEEVFKEIPEIDAVVGTGDFEEIGKIIKKVSLGEKNITLIRDINKPLSNELGYKRVLSTPAHLAFLKIAEGCDNKCTYCTIPGLRGRYRSREFNSLIKEAEILASKGVKELILVAQDVSLYGTDLYGENRLHLLLQELSKIEDILWIRLLYCYPEHITDETIEEMAQNKKICHYIDIPIQHSEDRILKLMNRGNTRKDLIKTIAKLRDKMPNISIRTTLISGFPGEREEDFEGVLDFIKTIKFNKLGVFVYSKEEGTPAERLPNQIDEDIKLERKNILMQTQKDISQEINKTHIGKTLCVLVEEKTEDNIYLGRSYMDSYEIDGCVFFKSSDNLEIGSFINVYIKDALEYDLIGDVVNESSK